MSNWPKLKRIVYNRKKVKFTFIKVQHEMELTSIKGENFDAKGAGISRLMADGKNALNLKIKMDLTRR